MDIGNRVIIKSSKFSRFSLFNMKPLPHFQNNRFTGISNAIVIENLRTELSITGVRQYKNVASQITAGKINGEIYLGSV